MQSFHKQSVLYSVEENREWAYILLLTVKINARVLIGQRKPSPKKTNTVY